MKRKSENLKDKTGKRDKEIRKKNEEKKNIARNSQKHIDTRRKIV